MEMKIIDERKLFNRNFKIYGTIDEPLFLAKDIANMIEYSDGNVSHMCSMVDGSEIRKIFCSILSTKPAESIGEANRLFLTLTSTPRYFSVSGRISSSTCLERTILIVFFFSKQTV